MPKKRNRTLAEGIVELPDGRLEVRIRVVDALGRIKWPRRRLPAGTLLSEAVALREELAYQLNPHQPQVMPTLGVYAERWLVRKAANNRCRPSTQQIYTLNLAHHVLPYLGHLPIDQIGRPQLLAWRDEIQAKIGPKPLYSVRTVRNWWSDGLRLLRDACADHDLPDPSWRLQSPVGTTAPRREQGTLSAQQLAAVFDALFHPRRRSAAWPAVALMLTTGMRRGEALAMRWDSVDLGQRLASIERAAYQDRHLNWSEDKPKNGKPRVVGLPEALVVRLREHRRAQLVAQHPGLTRGLISPGPDGDYCPYRTVRRAIERAAQRAGIQQRVTSQVLRRSFNTLALQVMDKVTVQALMGHADDAMTLHYTQMRGEAIRNSCDRLWSLSRGGQQ